MGTLKHAMQLKQVSCGYSGKEILGNVNLSIESGKLTVMMGRNGSGKSTLLKSMAGLLPFRGNILVHEKPLKDLSSVQRARQMAFLSQQHKAAFPFLVKEVVLTGRAAYTKFIPGKADKRKVELALEYAGIGHLRDRFYTELSGGEQQLVMIARLLAQESPLLLMDEPVSHLDYPHQLKVLDLAKQLVHQGKTIVMILHDPNLAFHYGDRFLFVHQQQVVSASTAEPWNEPIFEQLFEGKLQPISHQQQIYFIPQTHHGHSHQNPYKSL